MGKRHSYSTALHNVTDHPERARCGESVDSAGHSNLRLTKRVNHLRFPQARSVVFERQLFLRIVQPKAPQAVGIREFAQLAQLLLAQRRLQLISNFHECHAGIIPVAGRMLGETEERIGSTF